MTDDRMQPDRKSMPLWAKVLLAVGILYVAQFPIMIVGVVWDVWNSRRERDRLLHHTDHHALLKACRDLMVNHPEVSMGHVEDDPRIPEIIRRLGVSYITIKPDHVHIELHGGFDHYGVDAFAEGADRERGLKLIDGLWYYSEGG
jgi:hypothetical protein